MLNLVCDSLSIIPSLNKNPGSAPYSIRTYYSSQALTVLQLSRTAVFQDLVLSSLHPSLQRFSPERRALNNRERDEPILNLWKSDHVEL